MRWAKTATLSLACWAASASAAPDRFERAVLDEINRARSDPQAVAEDLRRYRAAFDGRIVREAGDPIGLVTIEGRQAVDEAIAFLETQPPQPPLDAGTMLAQAARGWAAVQGATGRWGHAVVQDATIGARMRAAGGDVYVGETISYGMATPAAVVRQLIVDDGQSRRGHRALVFSPEFRFAGVGCGAHVRFGTMCVIDYAGTPDGSPVTARVAAAQPSRASAFSR